MRHLRSKSGKDEIESTPLIKFDVKNRTGSQVNMLCIIKDKVIGEGMGDSDCAARDDAAFKAYYMVAKKDSCLKDVL